MKLNYKIIWVEDKIQTKPFETLVNNIKNFLNDRFFDVEIETAEDYEEFKDKFNSNGSFDLVITDYSLNDSQGNQVIDFIRMDKNILTEVFFYSANNQLRTIDLANNSRITFYTLVGGGYHNELQRKIEELIGLTISKFEHIVSMRGMIMQETSSLDIQMESIVKSQIKNKKLEEKISPILEQIFDNILKTATEKYRKAEKRNISDILKDNVLFSSSQKIFALGAILAIMEEDNFSQKYSEEIILIRNQFAHAELLKKETGEEYFKIKGEDIYFDAELCKKIRRDIITHKKNLDRIAKKITE
ncbi:response regulator [Macellibacteroides fermentans]|uniref:Response regulator receiver domain-containing protein n=1 Tax=Parabacteroides chartae TaxID=1037355 RepID=A0A1T5BSK2_9BACT|nr:response regulator [Parabacteroides chartae]SKB50332.1 Response regulator receiver domain-containing protein [Parabacteroides chartae]